MTQFVASVSAAPFGIAGIPVAASVPVGVGVGTPVTLGALNNCCGVSAPRAALQTPMMVAPCFQYAVNANPALYMLADNQCAVARVCGGKAYRSYAASNFGSNMFLTKGLQTYGVGCNNTFVAAPVTASACPCETPFMY